MKEEQYVDAVDAIISAIAKIDDEDVQAVWEAVSELWEGYEDMVMDQLDITD